MKKSIIFIALSIIISLCFYSCDPEIEKQNSISFGRNVSGIFVDSVIKNDTAYNRIYTFVCDTDTVFQFKYTQLLAPNHPIKAYFIPGTAFEKYKSEVRTSFIISPSILEWDNPQAYCTIEKILTPNTWYSVSINILANSTYEIEKRQWSLKDTTDIPDKIYYYYDWLCKMHYDYMQFNADDAVVSFDITRAVGDTVTPIDSVSVWKKYPNGQIIALSQSPWEVHDTIDLLKDTTYTYLLQGFLKGQACGSDVYQVQTHKGEVVSQQDVYRFYKGNIYEYDE